MRLRAPAFLALFARAVSRAAATALSPGTGPTMSFIVARSLSTRAGDIPFNTITRHRRRTLSRRNLMSYSFDDAPDRRGTGSLKTDKYAGRDIVPLWVADMDFAVAPCIKEALLSRMESGAALGYSEPTVGCTEAVVTHLKDRHAFETESSWIVYSSGVVQSLNVVMKLVPPGAGILVFTPIYPPFLSAPANTGRRLITVPLAWADGRWTFDWAAMDAVAAVPSAGSGDGSGRGSGNGRERGDGGVRMLMLCNPHNPVGRVFSEEELRRLGEWCEARDILICSDEIHSGLVLDDRHDDGDTADGGSGSGGNGSDGVTSSGGVRHCCIAALDGGRFAARTVTLNAPSKTFNIPGLGVSYAVISDPGLRRAFRRAAAGIITQMPTLGYVGCEAAYCHGEPWRQELVRYLRGNRDLVYDFLAEEAPELRLRPMEATYLAWVDASALGWRDPTLEFERAGVGLSDGKFFLSPGHMRINFGSPRAVVLEGLRRMAAAVKNRRVVAQ